MRTVVRTAVYGTCHAKALREVLKRLPEVSATIEFVPTPDPFVASVEELTDFETRIAPSVDLFLYQPLSGAPRGERFAAASLLESIPDSCIALSFQYMHFELYTPFVNLPGLDLAPAPFSYLDFGILAAFLEHLTPTQAAEHLAADLLSPATVAQIERWTLSELRRREVSSVGSVDFPMTDFIAANFRRIRLFHTINHPTGAVFAHLANLIVERLRGLGVFDASPADPGPDLGDPLDRIRFPCSPQVGGPAGLCFADASDALYFHGEAVTPRRCVERTYRYLDRKPRRGLERAYRHVAEKRPWLDAFRSDSLA